MMPRSNPRTQGTDRFPILTLPDPASYGTTRTLEYGSPAKADAIAMYRRIQDAAWIEVVRNQRVGKSAARPLAEVRHAQRRIDELERDAETDGETAAAVTRRFKDIVVHVVGDTDSGLALKLAQALLTASQSEPSDETREGPPLTFTNPYKRTENEGSSDET